MKGETMRGSVAGKTARAWRAAMGLALVQAMALLGAGTAGAQGMMQLDVPAAKYTLGSFTYEAPKADGWRQVANIQDSLALVYAEQKDEGSIDTRFAVTMEAHDIPENAIVEDAAALADQSRKQMAESHKNDLVGQSGVEAVPSIDNLYTYRLLVHSPVKGDPDVYEVYYVSLSPDKKQYLVMQCITKTQDYANEIYWTEFYGSLASLRYAPKGAAPADAAAGSAKDSPGTGKDAAGAEPVAHSGEAQEHSGEALPHSGEALPRGATAWLVAGLLGLVGLLVLLAMRDRL